MVLLPARPSQRWRPGLGDAMLSIESTLASVTVYREGAVCVRQARVQVDADRAVRFIRLPLSLEPGSLRAQVVDRKFSELAGDQIEGLPVRLRFPGRRNRRVERMHEGVEVGARDVVLLVPGGSRQHDIRIEA